MPSLTEICVRRPVFALMLTAALVVAGVVSYPQLGIARFPRLDLPMVTVEVAYPGAAPDEVETEVTRILEDAVATVAGIEELRSVSQDGRGVVLITFGLGRGLDAAVQDVRDAIATVIRRLPPTAEPPVVRQQDLDASPVLTLALSGPYSPRELFVFAKQGVKEVIESAAGVGGVGILGASGRAVRIDLDARRLAAYRISVLEVRDAIARQNVEMPGGRVDAGSREYTLRTIGRVPEARRFADVAVATGTGGTVRLGDLAEVSDGTKEVRQLARLDGQPSVVLLVQRQTDANTVATIRAVKERLARSRELLPPDVKLEILQDQSRYIEAALHEVQAHLVSGSLLATVVVLLFMRSWRSTLIAAVVIPASIVASFAFMRAFGFTLNNVTMLALVLMVGVVIDDAIVVLENIHRCIEERGMPPLEAAVAGTREIGPAVVATTLSLVIVFLPVSFLSSVAGRMLYEFGITATVAILVSMFVSFTLTPMMCSRLLRPAAGAAAAGGGTAAAAAVPRRGPSGWLEAGYVAALRWSLAHRWAVVAVSLAVVAANFWLARAVPRGYIPTNVDESEFEVSLTGTSGMSLAAIDAAAEQAAERVREVEGVAFVLATVGSSAGDVNLGKLYVRLTDIEERAFTWKRLLASLAAGDPAAAWRGNFTQAQKMSDVRRALASLPDVRVAVRNLTALRQGAPVDIDLALTGPSLEPLLPFAEQLRERVAAIPGVVDVDTTQRVDKPQLLARLDRERMADAGITVQEVADTLRIAVGGDDRVSRYRDPADGDVYDVELRLVGIDRGDAEAISQLFVRGWPAAGNAGQAAADDGPLRSASGAMLMRLDNVVDFQLVEEAGRIDRLDRQRMVAVRANVAPGFALGDRLAAVRQAAAELGPPPGVTVRVMGQGRELERTLGEFGWTFLLSIVFMYIVLAAQFEHLVHPITILLSLPLAVPFGLASLWAGGETLNLYSALGILVLFGVVKKAAILQIDHMQELQAAGLPQRQAILEANRDRLRPILMTTISFVAGMLPLLFASGPGAEERRSIAVVASGGQTFSLLLTLLAVPVIYSLLDDLGRVFRRGSPREPR
jgi:HAE1 family hydrophobic/amphiphilic exporter-1